MCMLKSDLKAGLRVFHYMRVAILSDIHGNQIALEAVLRDLKRQPNIDQLVIAGDLCLNGPRPRQTLDAVSELQCPVIMGNTDNDIVTGNPVKKGKKKIVDWTREQIKSKGIDYLASLPFSHLIPNPEGSDLLVVHANPHNLKDHIYPDASDSILEQYLGQLEPTIGALAFGHYHVAYTRQWRNLLLVDVGSCGLPRDKDLRAAYAILSWQDNAWLAEHRRVEYDVNAVVKQMETSSMPRVRKYIKTLIEATY